MKTHTVCTISVVLLVKELFIYVHSPPDSLLHLSCPLNSVELLMHIQAGDLPAKADGGELVMRVNGAPDQLYIISA